MLGPDRLDLAESVVQDALVLAMQRWPIDGVPDNTGGWLMRVAKNRALDILRKDRLTTARESTVGQFLEANANDDATEATLSDSELRDDQLRLLFISCHPVLDRDTQVALALKTLFGFDVKEIAAAFLDTAATIAQRLVRAKAKIRDAGLPYEMPSSTALPERLPSVLEVLYLLFREGYNTHGGDQLVRKDIRQEAMRLCSLVASHQVLGTSEVHALMALMCFNGSRLDARTDAAGDILLLEDEDRTLWNHDLIAVGAGYLNEAMGGDTLSAYHLQAGIAACHALAPSTAATDWQAIVTYYDHLMALLPSPIVALNRAVALAMHAGPEIGLAALAPLKDHPALESYYLLPGIEGEVLARQGQDAAAAACFRLALTRNVNSPERRWLERRLGTVM